MAKVVSRGHKRIVSNDGRIRWNQGDGSFKLSTKALAILPDEQGGAPGDIQAAIDTLTTANGGTVYLKNGTYIPNTSITVPSNITIVGESAGAVIIDFQNSLHQVLVSGSNVYTTGKIAVTNRSTTVTGTGTLWTSAMIGQTLLVRGVYYIITNVASSTSLTIDTPYEITTESNITYAVADPVANVFLKNMTVVNSAALDGAVNVRYCIGSVLDTVYVYDSVIGLNFLHSSGLGSSGWTIIGCSIGYSASYCGSWALADYFALDNGVNIYLYKMIGCSINNATVSSSTGNGITLESCRSVGLYDHTFTTNEGNGIECISSSDIEMFGMTVQYSGNDGIALTLGNARIGIQNVTLQGNTGYGINIAASSNSKNSLVMNFYTGNGAGTLRDLGTATISANNQT